MTDDTAEPLDESDKVSRLRARLAERDAELDASHANEKRLRDERNLLVEYIESGAIVLMRLRKGT